MAPRKTAGTVPGAGPTDRTQFTQSVPPFGATPPDPAQPTHVPAIMAAPCGPFQLSNATPHTPHQSTPPDKPISDNRSSKMASTRKTIDTGDEQRKLDELFTAPHQRYSAQQEHVTGHNGGRNLADEMTNIQSKPSSNGANSTNIKNKTGNVDISNSDSPQSFTTTQLQEIQSLITLQRTEYESQVGKLQAELQRLQTIVAEQNQLKTFGELMAGIVRAKQPEEMTTTLPIDTRPSSIQT